MNVNDFIRNQSNLGITNSVLTTSSKVNETLLDNLNDILTKLNNRKEGREIICNKILVKQSDDNSVNIQMSGSTEANQRYCNDLLKYFTDSKKSEGITIQEDGGSYKISTTKTTKTTTGSTITNSTTDSTTSKYSLSDIDKLVYASAEDQAKGGLQNTTQVTTTSESIPIKKILQEEIKKIKKLMRL